MSYYTPKSKIIEFIKKYTYPKPNDLNELTTLRQLKDMLAEIVKRRGDKLLEEDTLHHHDWSDDYIYGLGIEYMDELNENRLANEEKNIEFTKNVSLVTDKLPREMKYKIMSYGLEEPKFPTTMYENIKKLGGKSRRKTRRKSRRKSRRNKKNTRKHRK